MTDINELPYWIAISQLPRWKTQRKNQLLVDILPNKIKTEGEGITLKEFFNLSNLEYSFKYQLTAKEIADIESAKKNIASYSFKVDEILKQDIRIVTLNSKYYPKAIKRNLKLKEAPPLLYIKGNLDNLNLPAVSVVGSRNCFYDALDFTDKIVQQKTAENKVIVSGMAKGVDLQSLDSTIKYGGKSIVVLPQGILTVGSKINQYFNQILGGNVTMLSTFIPDAKWTVGLAMARNVYIYALAEQIFVAQSSLSGGTWNGAISGLERNMDVQIFYPFNQPNNLTVENKKAADELISKGAKAIMPQSMMKIDY